MQKKCNKIWSYQKKSSTFASAFAQKWGTPQEPKQMIFEKMSIITRCSTRIIFMVPVISTLK